MSELLGLTSRAEATHFWFQGFRSYVRPALREVTAGRRDLTLLDCGCGTGFNLQLLQVYGRAVGFDVTERGIPAARAAHAPIVRADITRIPFAAESFDVATSFDVLQCVRDDVGAVREMARVLRPGGAIVLTLAAFELLRGDHAEAWQEARRYTPATARRLVEQSGLRLERASFMFASLFPLMLVVRTAQRLLRPFRGLRPDTDIAVPAAPINAALTTLVTGEAALARRVPMPIGSSLLVIARKPA